MAQRARAQWAPLSVFFPTGARLVAWTAFAAKPSSIEALLGLDEASMGNPYVEFLSYADVGGRRVGGDVRCCFGSLG